jgi:hypothetical protein
MRCPVCDSSAKDITSNGFLGLSIRCLVDGDYDIDEECRVALIDLVPSDRHRVLSAAIRAGQPGFRPHITMMAMAVMGSATGRINEGVAAPPDADTQSVESLPINGRIP